MSETHAYLPLEGLPVPTLVLRGERVLLANAALLVLLGLAPEQAQGSTGSGLLAHLSPADRAWLEPLYRAEQRREPVPDRVWLRVRVADEQERTFCLLRGRGLHPEDTLLVLLDAEGEASMRRLTEALVQASGELMRCRDEAAVLEAAVEAIHRQGFYVSMMLVDGDVLVHGALRQHPFAVESIERLFGMPLREVRIPLSRLDHVREIFTHRKAVFHVDIFRAMEAIYEDKARLAQLRQGYPGTRGLDAPVFVEGKPFALLSVQGDALTPASAASLELFASQVGGALENVRHHRLAAERLEELTRLQAERVDQERLTVLGEAAGVVAHEVRNPLGAILNAVAVLKREKLGPLGTSAAEMLEEEATRLEMLVKDLLDVVRPLEPRPRPLDLGELARRTLELFQERRQLGGVRTKVDVEAELPLISADETLLQLALENLVRNAVQSSPRGGLVRVGVVRAPGGVALAVEDEGPGVSPANAQRVFEPFFTTRTNGTGLGLAVVRRVVTAHGGTISVGPRPGGGARFELRLPLQPLKLTG
jgi:signal transduction histidine kinase